MFISYIISVEIVVFIFQSAHVSNANSVVNLHLSDLSQACSFNQLMHSVYFAVNVYSDFPFFQIYFGDEVPKEIRYGIALLFFLQFVICTFGKRLYLTAFVDVFFVQA